MANHVPTPFKNPDSLHMVGGFEIHFKEKYKSTVQRICENFHPGDARLEGLILCVTHGSIALGSSKFVGEVAMASFEIDMSNIDEIRRSHDNSLVWKNENKVQEVYT